LATGNSERLDDLSLILADEELSLTQVFALRAEQLLVIDEITAQNEAQARRPSPALLGQEISLTPREEEVLALIGKGLQAAEIATSLTLSLPTVKSHTASLYRKLGVSSRTQALLKAGELGIPRR
jgi:DNA-binding NarL/FixJ family response regulator